MSFKATPPPEGTEDGFSFSLSTGLETKLNEKPAIPDTNVLGALGGLKPSSHLPRASHTNMVQPKLSMIVKKRGFAVEERGYSNHS